MGLEPPRSEIHTFKYEHEKLCSDVFVALYQTGGLYGWGQQRISKEVIPDRIFWLHDDLYYLEVEMGNHKEAIIKSKVEAYKRYWRESNEKFEVRFVTADAKAFAMLSKILEDEPYHYQAYTLDHLQKAVKSHSITSSNREESES